MTCVESCSFWAMFYGSCCMGWCQNRVQPPWCQVEHGCGCVNLPTLAGQVGLGVWLASWSPNQLDFSGLVFATSQPGQQLSFEVPNGLSSCGKWAFWKKKVCDFCWKLLMLSHVLWVILHGVVSEQCPTPLVSSWKCIWMCNFANPGWSSWIRGLTGQLIP